MAMTGQYAGVNAIIAGASQTNNGAAPVAVFDIEAAAGNGYVDSVQKMPTSSMPSLRVCLSMARVGQRNMEPEAAPPVKGSYKFTTLSHQQQCFSSYL
jgi:hypothetical protein